MRLRPGVNRDFRLGNAKFVFGGHISRVDTACFHFSGFENFGSYEIARHVVVREAW
jgi:hypothetical protein